MTMLSLDVAISTHLPEGIRKVEKNLPSPKRNVRYIVSWQDHQGSDIPPALIQRQDLTIYRFEKSGLSNNRNNAIKYCRGDIILISDDDLRYVDDFASLILHVFEEDKKLDLAVFKIKYDSPKVYPEKDQILKLPYPKEFYVSSVEIAFRKEKLRDLKFWSELGLGNSFLGCGEDEFFFFSAIKRGFNCKFINKYIAVHKGSTTGDKVNTSVLRGQGFVISAVYPFSFIWRLFLKAIRLKNNKGVRFPKALINLYKGALYYKVKRKSIPSCCRW